MSCQDDLAYTQQVIGQVQQGLAAQQVELATLRIQVLVLRLAQETVTRPTAVGEPSGGVAGPSAPPETRLVTTLATEAALHRNLTDMEGRLDKLEAR